MKEYKVPIQSLIDHIKTAWDVDPWAKEMAEMLLKEKKLTKAKHKMVMLDCQSPRYEFVCGSCEMPIKTYDNFCWFCGNPIEW